MELKNITTGNIISGVILIVVGILISLVGLGALFAYPETVWVVGLVFSVAGGIIIFYGIRNIEISRAHEKESGPIQLQMMQQEVTPLALTDNVESPSGLQSDPNPYEVLVVWKYTDAEWNTFIDWEKKERKLDLYIQAGWLTALGTVLIMLSREASIYVSLLISFSIGLPVAYLRYRFAISAVRNQSGVPPEVRISRTAFLINGKYNPFYTHRYKPERIKIIEEDSHKVLELRYGWGTRRGRTTEELRVPIPADKYEEAKILLQKIKT